MIKLNKTEHSSFDKYYDRTSPIFITEFEFNWNPHPHDYSVVKNYERLHAICMNKFDTLLSVCRLEVQDHERVGIGIIFHIDPNWTTYLSTKLISENALPNFKPLRMDGLPIKRDDSYMPLEKVINENLRHLLSKITTLRKVSLEQPLENNQYMDFLYGIKLYCKSVEEYDPDWILLDLVKCLESLGNYHNDLNGNSIRCESGKKIINALNIHDNLEKELIEEAYKIK